jgi:cytosine permease
MHVASDAVGIGVPAQVEGSEYTLSAVPEGARTAAYRIGIMLLASNISLPVFVEGGQLGTGLGVWKTAIASAWAGLILAIVAGTCAYAGARSRLTTYVLIISAFGRRGGKLINILLSVSAVGWFAVVVMLFAGTIGQVVGVRTGMASTIWALAGTMLMIGTTLLGFRALNLLSNISLPLKMLLLGWAVVTALRVHGAIPPGSSPGKHALDDGSAISFIVGGWIVGAVLAPDLARFARSPIGGAVACALGLGVGYPLILIITSIPARLSSNVDMIQTMLSLGLGIPAMLIVLLAAWANGASNLYSGSLVLAAVFQRSRRSTVTIGGAILGLGAALSGVTDQVVPYLLLLSIAIPPIAGVYLSRFFIDLRGGGARADPGEWDLQALFSCALGIAIAGFGDRLGLVLSGISAIDALGVSTMSYLVLECARRRIRPIPRLA